MICPLHNLEITKASASPNTLIAPLRGVEGLFVYLGKAGKGLLVCREIIK